MYRAIVWKELREQGTIGLTLVGLGAVLLAAATRAEPAVDGAAPSDIVRYLGVGRLIALMLAVTAGMVCGGAVFAAEREAGTMAFLESLPAPLRKIWRAKLLAGLTAALAQIASLLIVAAFLGFIPTFAWALAIGIYSLLAFVWGMFGSTSARTTLGSVAIAIPAASITAFFALIPVALFFQNRAAMMPRPSGVLFFLGCMFAVPLWLSAWLFSRTDRDREPEDKRVVGFGFNALLWLAYRQLLLPAPVIAMFVLAFGLALLAPGIQPFIFWPCLALAVGVLSAVTAFADEQSRGSARFWAEQRLPLGRAWAAKMLIHLLFCFALLVLLAIPLAIQTQLSHQDSFGMTYVNASLSGVFNAPVMDDLGRQGWIYLLLPAIYGFAAGHLCGLIFRKLVVACAVAGVLGGVGTVLWGPSLLAGGVHFWQLLMPPALALATGRILIRSWAADILVSRRALIALSAGCLAVVATAAIGIGYRVLEVPDSPQGEDDIRYLTTLISIDENTAGREFKTAAERYSQTVAALAPKFEKLSLQAPRQGSGRPLRIEERLEQVSATGWPAKDAVLEDWLDGVYSLESAARDDLPWHALVATATQRPPGIYEHPQLIGASGVSGASLDSARRMTVAVLARGLQLQARGDSAAFLPAFRSALAVARTMRNGSVVACFVVGCEIERVALYSLDRWLEKLPPQAGWLRLAASVLPSPLSCAPGTIYELGTAPDQIRLLRDFIELLEANDPHEPFDPMPQFLAERHVVREALKAPTQTLSQPNPAQADSTGGPDPVSDLLSVAWALPWEKERTRRLVGLGYESGLTTNDSLLLGRPGRNLLAARSRTPADLSEIDRQLRTARRIAILKLGLRAFRLERGSYPETLAELVAKGYLHRVPGDPYLEQKEIGYRISPGETLKSTLRYQTQQNSMVRETLREQVVPAGQAILWSVGPDRIDQGGTNPPGPVSNVPGRAEDMVYLVPLGPNW